MKQSTKAALLSGLIFPGTGQIHLKRFRRGIIIMIFAFSGIGMMVWMVTLRTLAVFERIHNQLNHVDMAAITNTALISSAEYTSIYYTPVLLFLVCCWLFSVLDAYMIGKRMDRSTLKDTIQSLYTDGD